jgi:chemotaxis protein CheX
MNVEYVNPFLSSLVNVLSTMANTTIVPGQPRIKKDEVARGDVSGLIGMIGPKTINEEVTDMVGEITNMVTGGAKRILGEKGYEFSMATPVVVSGKGHTITHKCDGPKILMPFDSDFGKVHIEVSFDNQGGG